MALGNRVLETEKDQAQSCQRVSSRGKTQEKMSAHQERQRESSVETPLTKTAGGACGEGRKTRGIQSHQNAGDSPSEGRKQSQRLQRSGTTETGKRQ